MEFALIIILILVGVVVITIHSKIQFNKRTKVNIISMFGMPPEKVSTEFESVRQYTEHIETNDLRIDSITWNDLDMDRVFERVNNCQSSVGEEYLYNILHQPQYEESSLLDREKLINFFDEHPEERLAVQIAMAKLGKQNYNGLANLIFNAEIKLLPRAWLYNFLAILPLIMATGLIFNIYVGAVGILLSFMINLFVHYSTMKLVNIEIPVIGYFALMMKCCYSLLKIEPLGALPIMIDLKKPYNKFKSVVSKAPAMQSGASGDLADALWVYFSIMFLYDIRNYNNFMKMVISNNKEFHELYKTIGEIDSAVSILSFRKSLPSFSLPVFHQENSLDFDGIFHPLIEEPVTNTYYIKNDSLITGSNASGKSTFIKTLAINGILAQTIFTCTATKFATRFTLVVTSMAMRDNLQGGESYFIVEIKSLKRILDLAQKYPCVCYVDEILRGTNTVERIAASASVLSYLHKQDCLCLAASHDIELTHILADLYDNYNFCEQVTDNDIIFDYKLKQGPSTTRNAIKLLNFMGFGEEIIENADVLADTLNRKNELVQLRDHMKRREQKLAHDTEKKAMEKMIITTIQNAVPSQAIEALRQNAGITETRLAELREQENMA